MAAPRAHGEAVEAAACHFLEQRGLQCMARNYNTRGGELDLVMREADTLVFVEVRFRKSDAYGTPAETVTRSKQQKLLRTAQLFLLAHKDWQHKPCRFDIVAARPGESGLQFEWIKNAFGV